jgi:hypothetical protein
MERRAYERTSANFPVILLLGSIHDSCNTKDLSINGLYLKTWKPLPQGMRFEVVIPSKGNLKLSVKVARMVEKDDLFDGLGIEVLNPPRGYIECIDIFMKKKDMKIVLKIDDAVINQTTKCLADFQCLTIESSGICSVDRPLDGNGLFINEIKNEYCSYMMPFGTSSHICTCPTRNESYSRYNV